MKKIVFLILFIVNISTNAQSLNDVLVNKNYTIDFVGIDFSNAKLVGTSHDFKNPKRIITDYFSRWNAMFYIDADKYNLNKYFHKKKINLITETVEKINNNIDESTLIVNTTPKRLNNTTIQLMIDKYEISSDNKISMVFIVNSFHKLRRQAIVDVVYFNNQTKKIIFKTTMIEEPGGFGLKNFWEGAFLNIFKKIKKTEYKKWKKQYKN